jgi:tetraacyldisaccharide 4'-kinase
MRNYLHGVIIEETKDSFSEGLRFILFVLSLIYIKLMQLQDWAYRYGLLKSAKVKARVISVGNITWGGTGKTSMIILLTEFFAPQGKSVAILSRGYGRTKRYPLNAIPLTYQDIGDEAYMLQQKFPDIAVLVGPDRIKNARKAVDKLKAEIILLDDGFQHRRLSRDLDIVLIDVLNPFGNEYCIPRGSLREPKEGLKRAHIIVLTNCEFDKEQAYDLTRHFRQINPKALIVQASYRFAGLFDALTQETVVATQIVGKSVCLLASIGNFESFRKTFSAFVGGKIVYEFNLPDHYRYIKDDLRHITDTCIKHGAYTVVTTEKDMVRLQSYLNDSLGIKIIVLKARLEILENQGAFFGKLNDVSAG